MLRGKVVTALKTVVGEDWDENEDESNEPDEGDAFLSPTGPLGSRTSLSVDEKFIGEYASDEKAEEALVNWIIKNQYYPNIWYVSDHGNVGPYELSDKSKKKLNS